MLLTYGWPRVFGHSADKMLSYMNFTCRLFPGMFFSVKLIVALLSSVLVMMSGHGYDIMI
jgi:hypothetical protein